MTWALCGVSNTMSKVSELVTKVKEVGSVCSEVRTYGSFLVLVDFYSGGKDRLLHPA